MQWCARPVALRSPQGHLPKRPAFHQDLQVSVSGKTLPPTAPVTWALKAEVAAPKMVHKTREGKMSVPGTPAAATGEPGQAARPRNVLCHRRIQISILRGVVSDLKLPTYQNSAPL